MSDKKKIASPIDKKVWKRTDKPAGEVAAKPPNDKAAPHTSVFKNGDKVMSDKVTKEEIKSVEKDSGSKEPEKKGTEQADIPADSGGFTTPAEAEIDITKYKFTDKQKMFAKNYLIDFNATQAAIRAGYSKNSSRQTGSDNLANPYIRHLIKIESEKKIEKIDNLTDRIVGELVKIGFSDIKNVLSFDAGGVTMKSSEDVDGTILSEVSSSDTKEGINMKAKLHDKIKALELLGRFQGMWNDKLQVEHNIPVRFEGEDKL